MKAIESSNKLGKEHLFAILNGQFEELCMI